MIDIVALRKNPKLFRQATKNKGYDPDVVDEVVRLDRERRGLIPTVEKLRAERNELSGKQTPEAMEKGRLIKKKIKSIEPRLKKVETDLKELLLQIPNLPAKDVPIGKDESENKILRKWAGSGSSARRDEPTRFDFKPRDHLVLGKMLDILDVERAVKVSGSRFGYLKNEAVLLEFALVQYALRKLTEEGFQPVVPPILIKRKSMRGMGYLEHGGEEDMYVLEKDDMILVGTSEQSIGPMHMDTVLNSKDLPRRYAGFSTCFRREAGSYGKDTRGIFRVHQFDKVEMFSFVKPEDGDDEHELLLSIEENLFQNLGIPYQVVKMCTGDLGAPVARKYDLEAWLPSQNKYREITSTSTTTDFQARRLNIKYQADGKTRYVHMLNGTAFAVGRTLIAILENFQRKDGSVVVPKVLRGYVGKSVLKPRF